MTNDPPSSAPSLRELIERFIEAAENYRTFADGGYGRVKFRPNSIEVDMLEARNQLKAALAAASGAVPPHLQTECCDAPIAGDARYCPKCGWEARVREGGAVPPATDWQPIATAPKDGTRVLLWWPHWREYPVTGRYFHGEWDCIHKCEGDDVPPTHWMPLPDPPPDVPHA